MFELIIGALIVVLAVWLGSELLTRARHSRRAAAFADDLRAIADAHQRAFPTPRSAPAKGPNATAVPAPDLERLLRATNGHRGSPFGGTYEWILPPAPHPRGPPAPVAVTVTAFSPQHPLTCTRADLLQVDAAIDDGDLATGRFRTGFNGWPVYRLTD